MRSGHTSSPQRPGQRDLIRLGLRENLGQFMLLVAVNALVGGTLGQERTVLPLLAEKVFHLDLYTSALTYILAFGVAKAATNYFAGTLSDRYGRKPVLVAGGMLVQAMALGIVALGNDFGTWLVAVVLLGAGTAMVYPTLLAVRMRSADHRRLASAEAT